MIIAVDFDGVIIPAGCWPGVGEANAPLIEWLKELREATSLFFTCFAKFILHHIFAFYKYS